MQSPGAAENRATIKAAPAPRKFEYVDALRGWAFLGVFYTHFSRFTEGLPRPLQSFLGSGHYGVQLFFLMSAYTLFHSLHGRKRTGPWIADFYLRRYFRIAPMFYAAIVGFGLLGRWLDGHFPGPAETLFGLTLTSGFSTHYYNSPVPGQWSVGDEVIFYAFVPLFFTFVRSATSAAVTSIVLLVAGELARRVAIHFGIPDGEYLKSWLPAHAYVFPLGFLLFFLVRDSQKGQSWTSKIPPQGCLVGGLIATVAVLSNAEHIPGSQKFTIVALLVFVYGLTHIPNRFFVNRLIGQIGTVSYSAYLVHFVVLELIVRFAAPSLQGLGPWGWLGVSTVVVLPVCVALASLTYRFVELPGLSLGKRVIARLDRAEAR